MTSCWKLRGIISFNPLSLENEYLEYVHFTEGKAEAASALHVCGGVEKTSEAMESGVHGE